MMSTTTRKLRLVLGLLSLSSAWLAGSPAGAQVTLNGTTYNPGAVGLSVDGLAAQFHNSAQRVFVINNAGLNRSYPFENFAGYQHFLGRSTPATLGAPNLGATTVYTNVDYANTNGGAAAPYAALGFAPTDNITARFTGFLEILPGEGGDTTFTLQSDDGSVLWIDGQQVVFNNASQGWTSNGQPKTGTISLSEGRHEIVVGHFEGTGGAGIQLRYDPAGAAALQTIPVMRGADQILLGHSAATIVDAQDYTLQASTLLGTTNALRVDAQQLNVDFTTLGNANITLSNAGQTYTFTGTSFNANGTLTLTPVNSALADFSLGRLNDNGNTVTIVKTGVNSLVLDHTAAAATADGITFDVQGSNLVVVGSSTGGAFNPLGGANVVLNAPSGVGVANSALVLSSINGGTVTFDNAVAVNADSAVVGQRATFAAGNGTINLGSATNGITIAGGATLDFVAGPAKSDDNTALNIQGSITGAGGIRAVNGTTNLLRANTFTGATTVNIGATLRTGVLDALTGSSIVVNNGGTLYSNVTGGVGGSAVVSANTGGIVRLQAVNAVGENVSFDFNGGTLRLDTSNALRRNQLLGLRFGSGDAGQLHLVAANMLSTSDAGSVGVNIFNGARATIGNSTAVGAGQSVAIFAGGVLEDGNVTLNGAGTISLGSGSVVRLTSGVNMFGTQVGLGDLAPNHVLQLNRDGTGLNFGGLNAGVVVELFGNTRTLTAVDGGATLSGLYLTHDGTDRTLNSATGGTNRSLFVGAGGLTIAGRAGGTFTIAEDVVTNSNALTIGTFRPLNNALKTGTVNFSNAANNFAGTTVDVNAGATLRGSGNVAVFSTLNARVFNGTVRVDSVSGVFDVASVETAGRTVLSASRTGTTVPTTISLGAPLTRTNRGTLALHSQNNVLGSSAVTGERILFADPLDAPARATVNGGSTEVNMVAPWMVNISGSNTASFVDYDATFGFVNATYTTAANIAAFTAATNVDIVDVTGALVNVDTVEVAALRTSQNITGAGQINLTTGGLIIASTTARTIANAVDFGTNEGVVYSINQTHILSGVVSGSNGLTKFGAGGLSLTNAANSFTGDVTVNEGLLHIGGADGALGNAANDVFLNGGGGLQTNTMNFTRDLTLREGSGRLDVNSGQTLTMASSIAGAGMLVKSGAGTLVMTTANTYAGGTQIDGGVLNVSSDAQLGSAAGFVTVNNAVLQAGADFTSARGMYMMNANSRIDTQGFDVTLSGEILGSGGLVKNGAGDLVLSRAGGNGYLGNTTVTAGRLLVNNTSFTGTGAGTVTVAAAGTLGGTGAIAGAVTVSGVLSPGASAGTLELYDSLTMANNSTLDLELGGLNPGDTVGSHDQVNLTSLYATASIGTNVSLDVSLIDGFALNAGDVFYVLTRADDGGYGNAFAGFGEGALVDSFSGVDLFITYLADWTGDVGSSSLTGGNDVALFASAVPEPSTFALLGLAFGSFGLHLVRRRRNRAA